MGIGKMKFECYHGTRADFADNILNTKCYQPHGTRKDWLGEGCYFYVECKESAFNYCITVKRIPPNNIVVLHTVIESEDYYDLTQRDVYARYKFMLYRFRRRLSKQKDFKSYPRILDGEFLTVLHDELDYDYVVAKFKDNAKYKRGYSRIVNPNLLFGDNIKKVICVKNVSCIDSYSIKEAE